MSFKPMILHQFGSVYNLIIRPDSTQFLEKKLSEIAQRDFLVEKSELIKQIAREYAKNNGQYCDGQTFKVLKMENPPLECAEDTREELGRIDFLGVSIPLEDEMIKKYEIKWDHLFFAVLSDVWLDEYKVRDA
ncbi:9692_t:CDS:2 [Acaulospora colombiana]|uniref:9692_t:CDS:1 n=1 Tax=Acaulospora colombiana TaxID=27376 RepID=A0ACA9KXM1_9GLOM|nr:9692_t:CDS:2 [Acaulospora colombiana]